MTPSEQVRTSKVADGSVLLIEMDDGKANALSSSMINDISAALAEAEADDAIVAAVLAGREGRFSAGFDLSVIRSGDPAAIANLVADGGQLVRTIYGCGVPVVAACTGHALAAGALMLLGSDVRVGAEGPFKVGLNEVAIGLTLPDWAHTIAYERLSKRHIQRAIANARVTGPADAIDVGYLDRMVPADQVVEAAIEEAAAMSALDLRAYRRTMSGFRKPTLDLMDSQIASDRQG
ncbi:MAG: crotonase/enoyl-CoA hydratase family protein [Acidimicrobiales bacterium]